MVRPSIPDDRSSGFINPDGRLTNTGKLGVLGIVLLIILAIAASFFFKSVPAGHVGVATLFGDVVEEEYSPGMHFPVNPLLSWTEYDVRDKEHKEVATVPSRDQLTTEIDVSVVYRVMPDRAARMKSEVGTRDDALNVHIVPKLRSLVREQGKTVDNAEEFFQSETQERLTRDIQARLIEYLEPKGIEVQAVLLRDFRLPPSILANVELKKQAEQKIEQAAAELEQAKVKAQTQVEEAKAAREAAEEEAEKRKVLAAAQAFEIEAINAAIAQNPAYIQLEALKALQAISGDPAAKLYFMDGNSPMPLPLMNLGEPLATAGAPPAAARAD
jgi:regulator of protease activity HflC (stomatin/prohibitin superfamily)